MNIFIITLVIFVIIYLLLNWFVKSSTKKVAKTIRSMSFGETPAHTIAALAASTPKLHASALSLL